MYVMSCGSCPARYHLRKEVNYQACIPSLQGKSKYLKPTFRSHSFSQDTLAFGERACNLWVTTESHCVRRVRKQATKRKDIEKEIHGEPSGHDSAAPPQREVTMYDLCLIICETLILKNHHYGAATWRQMVKLPWHQVKITVLKKPLHPEGTKNNVIIPNPSSHEMKI